jgi:hypothetical protein
VRLPQLPPDYLYFRARLDVLRGKAHDKGGVTLEWMVVAGALFLAAVTAAARIVAEIREHSGKIR